MKLAFILLSAISAAVFTPWDKVKSINSPDGDASAEKVITTSDLTILSNASSEHVNYYKVNTGTSDNLVDKVRTDIENGWQPLGGISYDPASGGIYAQAMVK